MNFSESMDYLHSLEKFGIRLGLHRILRLAELMGNPHREIPTIHVGGTNGKGSVTAMLSSVLRAAGFKTGTYISPALHRFNERISIDGCPIADEVLAGLITELKPLAEQIGADGDHPTEFEVVTAAAWVYFKRERTDIVVMEVGLGGRLDSTNIIEKPLVSVITNVGLDHMQILGDTIEKIAEEKAGIIKDIRPVVTGTADQDALLIIERQARQKKAPLYILGRHIKVERNSIDWYRQTASIQTMRTQYDHLEMSLLGMHQVDNAGLVLGVLDILKDEGFAVSEVNVRDGFKQVFWPGRFEVVGREPITVIDGAHNVDGARVLRQTLHELASGKQIILVVGILKDKDWLGMIRELAPMADTVITVRPDSPRALDENELATAAQKLNCRVVSCRTVRAGIEYALNSALAEDIICVTGSLVTAAEARSYDYPLFNRDQV